MFITFEGPEGGGKTTQAQLLVSWLLQRGYDVLAVREPGGTEISDAIRHILLDFVSANLDARAELLLFCASRAQLVSEKITPHLVHGGMVVCDRFADSTLAYQGFGRGLDIDLLRNLLAFATHDLRPDLTLLLDVDVDTGLQRKAGNVEWNRLDAETIEFHRRVRAGYQTLANDEPERWRVINAQQPTSAVTRNIQQVVQQALENQKISL
jgi:dTMP kinase